MPMTTFFIPDGELNDFKVAHPTKSHNKVVEECKNHHFAAEKPRPTNKNFSSSGIALAVCGHAFPLIGASMKTGEKFAYAHAMLLQLLKSGWVPAFLEYDIACRFHMYLRKYEPELLAAFEGLHAPGVSSVKGASVIAGIKLALGK
jgi:hypothetical protein